MGLLDWFRSSTPKLDEARISQASVDEAIDYVVKVTDARLTLVDHYRPRLSGPVRRTLEHLVSLRDTQPPTHEASALAWATDPTLRAMFSQTSELVSVFQRSDALRDFAAGISPLDPVYAVLGMDFEEQRHFGAGLQGQLLVRDVARTTLNFRQHRLRLFARSEIELVRAFSRRMLDELALIALERMQAENETRRELEEDRQLIAARIATFNRRGIGGESFLGEAGAEISASDSQRLLRALEENETRLAALGSPAESLDRQLDYLAQTLAEPMRHIRIETRRLHVDSMNCLVDAAEDGETVEFGVACFGRRAPVLRAFLPVLVDRSLIGEGRKLRLENAERWL